MNYECKNISGSVADVDSMSRRVKVAVSEMGSKDLDNDVIDDSAYNRTINQRGPKGANMIWHLTDHNASLKAAIGKPSEIYKDGNKLIFVTDIAKTSWGNDVMEMYSTGAINQHSIGFRTLKSEPQEAGTPGEYRLIKEILLYEGSAVLWGANPNTPTISVGKSLTSSECQKDFFAAIDEMNNLHKLFKAGHLSDETFELLEMHLAQKTEKLKQLFKLSTQSADNTAPDSVNEKDLLEVLKTFNNLLIIGHGSQRTQATT